jgi:tRNA A37 N6-isopentenylltransferase MiaA
MVWSAVEEVRQLQQAYEHLAREYASVEEAYRAAREQADPAQADALYADLERIFPQMSDLYQKVNEARTQLARETEEAVAAV